MTAHFAIAVAAIWTVCLFAEWNDHWTASRRLGAELRRQARFVARAWRHVR